MYLLVLSLVSAQSVCHDLARMNSEYSSTRLWDAVSGNLGSPLGHVSSASVHLPQTSSFGGTEEGCEDSLFHRRTCAL